MKKAINSNAWIYGYKSGFDINPLIELKQLNSVKVINDNKGYSHIVAEKIDINSIVKKLMQDYNNDNYEKIKQYIGEISRNLCQILLLKKQNIIVLVCNDIREWSILVDNTYYKLDIYDLVNKNLLEKIKNKKIQNIFEIDIDTYGEISNSVLLKGDNLELSNKFKILLEEQIRLTRVMCKIQDNIITFAQPNKINIPNNMDVAKLVSILHSVCE